MKAQQKAVKTIMYHTAPCNADAMLLQLIERDVGKQLGRSVILRDICGFGRNFLPCTMQHLRPHSGLRQLYKQEMLQYHS